MAVRPQYLAYVLGQLEGVRGLRSSRMFSGVGLYGDGIIFGLLHDDTLYFKTGESNITPYRERGMPRFMPFPDRAQGEFGYRCVPADVIEDADELVTWARAAVAAAHAMKASKPARRKPAKKSRKS